MDVTRVLKELVAVPEQPFSVASVYLDFRWADEHSRERVRIFVQDEVRRALRAQGHPARDGEGRLAETLEAVEQFVGGLIHRRSDEWVTGTVVFSCAPAGLFKVLRTRMSFSPMAFLLDRRPCVTPLVKACSEAPPLIVAAVDSKGARLWEQSYGLVDVDARIERPFPGRHSMDVRFSQASHARHIDELADRNLRSAAEPLVRMSDARPSALIAIAGQMPAVHQFEGLLPERVRERVFVRLPFSAGLPEGALRDEILGAAGRSLDRALRNRWSALRDVVVQQAAQGSLATMGARDVLLALAEGRVHRLLLDADYRAAGWRCAACGAVGDERADACSYCGGATRVVGFPEEMIRLAVRENAEVVLLPHEAGLPPGAGAAAQLRSGRAAHTHEEGARVEAR